LDGVYHGPEPWQPDSLGGSRSSLRGDVAVFDGGEIQQGGKVEVNQFQFIGLGKISQGLPAATPVDACPRFWSFEVFDSLMARISQKNNSNAPSGTPNAVGFSKKLSARQ